MLMFLTNAVSFFFIPFLPHDLIGMAPIHWAAMKGNEGLIVAPQLNYGD